MGLDLSLEFFRGQGPIFFVTFKEEFTRISVCPYSQSTPQFTDAMFIDKIKILPTTFEKGHPRNISVKLF